MGYSLLLCVSLAKASKPLRELPKRPSLLGSVHRRACAPAPFTGEGAKASEALPRSAASNVEQVQSMSSLKGSTLGEADLAQRQKKGLPCCFRQYEV